RAEKFMAALRQFTTAAQRTAGRLAGTAQDPAMWARVIPAAQPAPSIPPAATRPTAPPSRERQLAPAPDVTAGELAVRPAPGVTAGELEFRPAPGAPPGPAPPSPAAPAADRLAETAASHGLTVVPLHGTWTPWTNWPAQAVQVLDAGHEVLLHRPGIGATAGGVSVPEADVPAYLAAYRAGPHLPPPP